MRTCAHIDLTCDHPEDVLCLCAARQDHLFVRGLHNVLRGLQEEDVVGAACQGEIRGDVDIYLKGVDARCQSQPTNESSAGLILEASVLTRPAASVYAISMSPTAVVSVAGMGAA
jgi:hypothetical protein